jgi:filamentous hemagglutinin
MMIGVLAAVGAPALGGPAVFAEAATAGTVAVEVGSTEAVGIGVGRAVGPATDLASAEVASTSVAAEGPTLFRNLAPLDEIAPQELFPASQIQRIGYTGKLEYVVLESGDLVIGRSGHISLAQGADVLAAGEARFFQGAVKRIDNMSGHYQPAGASAQAAAEAAFNRAGFDATGRYVERVFK